MPPSLAKDRSPRPRAPTNAYLAATVRAFRPTIASLFVFSFFINLLTLVVPLYLLQIYSKVLPSGNVDTLVFLTGMALCAVLALGGLEAVRRSILAKAGVRFEARVSEHLLTSAMERAIAKARVSVNVMRDLSTVRGFVSGSTVLPLLDLPWSPLFIVILFLLHPLLGFIGLAGALVMVALAVANERATREPLQAANAGARELLDDARGYVRNADVVRSMGMRETLLARWRTRNADAMVGSYRAGRINTRLASLSKMIRLFLQIAIVCAAAWLIIRQQLTPGATIASVLLLRRAISPLEQSIRSWKSVLSARDAFRSISEYLDHAPTLEAARDMPTPSGALQAAGVSARAPGTASSLFSRVQLELEPGTVCALTGPTGVGKSTMLRVLAGLLPPSSGRLTLGGYDLSRWAPEQLGAHVGYLPQDVCLFAGTVRDNIARMRDAPVETVVAAAELANAHAMIQALPQGYDTVVAEEGMNLSGGQRQRIGYARALFGEPVLVLLDEPDANLDAEGRSLLRKSLRELRRRGLIVVAITHHTSLEKVADLVLRLEDGRLREVRRDEPRDTDEDEDRQEDPGELQDEGRGDRRDEDRVADGDPVVADAEGSATERDADAAQPAARTAVVLDFAGRLQTQSRSPDKAESVAEPAATRGADDPATPPGPEPDLAILRTNRHRMARKRRRHGRNGSAEHG